MFAASVALGMWPAIIDANVAAIAAQDHTRRAVGEEPAGCSHYLSWLAYAYLQLGQTEKARNAITTCRAAMQAKAATEHPSQSMDPDDSLAGSFANMRLRYLLDFAFARAMGEIEQGHVAAARAALGELEAAAHEVVDIETKEGDSDPSYRVRAEIFVLEGRGLLAEQEKDLAGAEKLLRQAAALEETLPIAFGPPAIDKPTHELLEEFLLRHERADEVQKEFKMALARTPGRRLAERGFEGASAGVGQGGR